MNGGLNDLHWKCVIPGEEGKRKPHENPVRKLQEHHENSTRTQELHENLMTIS